MYYCEAKVTIKQINPNLELIIETNTDKTNKNTSDLRKEIRNIDNSHIKRVIDEEDESSLPVTGKYLWGASGVTPVLQTENENMIIHPMRDDGAPTYKEHLTTLSGLSDSLYDLFHPRQIAIREGVEEVLYMDKQGTLLIPDFKRDNLAGEAIYNIMNHWIDINNGNNQPMLKPLDSTQSISNTENVPAKLVSIGDDKITIVHQDSIIEKTYTGKIALDNDNNMIDIIDLLLIDLSDYKLSELHFLDGEVHANKIINRSLYMQSIEQFKRMNDDIDKPNVHRKCRAGHYWNGSEWVDKYEDGIEYSVDDLKAVPNIKDVKKDVVMWCEENL